MGTEPVIPELRLTPKQIREMVLTVRGYYPDDIFHQPVAGKLSCPDAYSASGARMACDLILRRLAELEDGNN
jgi:hypothetical protein